MTFVRLLTCLALSASLLSSCSDDRPDNSPSAERESKTARERGRADPEQPAATVCEGRLGAVEVPGDLLVPRGSTCRLEGTAVAGRTTVPYGASLISRDSRFGEGIGAHSFDRVVLRGGRAEGRPRTWFYATDDLDAYVVDFVFVSGRSVVVEDGPINGAYYVLDNTGRVEVSRLYLDLGSVYCQGNTREPVVRGISAESPDKLRGQCAGLKNFGATDF